MSGKWLLPAEVEDCLAEHPAVTEAAVVGVPDASGLVKPVAFVVSATGERGAGLEEDLRRHCLARLDAYKHPRRVVVVAEMPRTHLGKVDRGALRRLAGSAASAHVDDGAGDVGGLAGAQPDDGAGDLRG
ncbi:MAG: AMP-binding enzyme [Acidimicrobiales bacterium]